MTPATGVSLDGFDCGEGDRAIAIDEGVARTFLCGTATATLTYDSTTEQLSGGTCNVGGDVVEIGSLTATFACG